jgi:hypothetical protein
MAVTAGTDECRIGSAVDAPQRRIIRALLGSYNDGHSMNAATRDKMIGGVVLFATFAFFSTIIAGSPASTPPVVSLTTPVSDSTVSGTTALSAAAKDNVGVTAVEFKAENTLLATDATTPYSFAWNTAAVTNGSYVLATVAQDAAGNRATSAVNVTVANTAPWSSLHDGSVPVAALFEGRKMCSITVTQMPGQSDLFIGRIRQIADPSVCGKTGRWTLALYKMDWSRHELHFQQFILTTPVTAPRGEIIDHAYDVDLTLYNSEIWASFECVTRDKRASACIAPLAADGKSLDTNRLSIAAMDGPGAPDDGTIYSGSIPQLLSWNSKIYLYWTAVHRLKSDSTIWLDIGARGMELQPVSGRLWGVGSGGKSVSAGDPTLTSEVLYRPAGDPSANMVGDIAGVYANGSHLLITSSIGGIGCINPKSDSPGCYRLQISRSTAPLGPNVFGHEFLVSPSLPLYPLSYARIVHDPDGNAFLLGFVNLPPSRTKNLGSESPGVSGLRLYPLQLDQMRFANRRPTIDPATLGRIMPPTWDTYINHLYRCILERAPDASGFGRWKNILATGTTTQAIYSGFFASSGYASKGTSDRKFIEQASACILLRAPSKTGRTSWLNQLTGGMSRAEVIRKFVASPEFTQQIRPALKSIPGIKILD